MNCFEKAVEMKNLSKKRIGFIVLTVLLLGALLAFLVPKAPTYIPSQPLPGMTPINPSNPPSWLLVNHPTQGQAMSLADYITFQGGPSSICIEVSPLRVDPIDPYSWTADKAVERTIVLVDVIQRYKLPTSPVWDLMMTGGPYNFCVYAPVTPGLHKVDVSFKTSAGWMDTFSWTFEVFGGTTPSPTPLPTPVEIDREKHFPSFLRAVYPNPGQVVSLAKYVSVEHDDQRVWTWDGQSNDFIEKMQGTICLAFNERELDQLGVLDWSTRAYVQVDGNVINGWRGPNIFMQLDQDHLEIGCPPAQLDVGTHTISLYMYPYGRGLTSYSWEFTITK
jgi:hypothetical protein